MNKFLLLILIPLFSFSQNIVSDSLKKVIDDSNNDNFKSLKYSELAKAYRASNLDSAIYYANEGYNLAKEQSYNLGIANNLATLGDLYVVKNELEQGKKFYEESLKFFDVENSLYDKTRISMIIGNIYLAQNQYIEALELYQACLDISKENKFKSLLPHLFNNLGTLYLQIKEYDDALANYNKASLLFQEAKDSYSAAIALSNIANIKDIRGDSEEAIVDYLKVVQAFTIAEKWADMARVYNLIAQIYNNKADYIKAEKYADLALKMLEESDKKFVGPLSIYQTDIYTITAKIALNNKNIEKANKYAHKAFKLAKANSYKKHIYENAIILSQTFDESKQMDSILTYKNIFIKYNEEYQKEKDVKRITELKMQYEFDEIIKNREIAKIKQEAEYRHKELLYISILIVVVLVLISVVLLFLNQKEKTARVSLKKENLELEQEKLNQEIEYKKKELASNMIYLVEKNELIIEIAKELIELKTSSKKDNQNVIQQLVTKLRQNSSTKVWNEFELRFKEVHSDFYHVLREKYPDLTPNEIKLCAFLRLNMSTKEISSITHQSVKSINMARYRLRKKLNIDTNENLITYLTQL
ncbi:tetratricopeptide repeat protein [Aequorivita sp. KMM 9714]|uniref:tetratricopeptide repeat protein n=1 Tax=Aequorivita sp. KMM 9714 TaxID=2707173 RepID=UPI0013EA40F4|nr:tetratricopeptide repeat protein [Aequorivita sp. KMM 9714]NGX85393.1 tetratricopeptide repeat protein [Aequorivita sp. KMM 9714]